MVDWVMGGMLTYPLETVPSEKKEKKPQKQTRNKKKPQTQHHKVH